jgi:hypothetical protein
MKLKSLWCSFFQVQNSYMISKSMKHLDAPLTNDETSSSAGSTNGGAMVSAGSLAAASSVDLNDYRIRREKNNESVRKSRAKNRVKLQECASHVEELRKENTQLNKHLDGLNSELFTLKGLFQHCFSFNLNNLAIKPSEIPTSALYKIIMQKDQQLTPGEMFAQQSSVNAAAHTSDVDMGMMTPANTPPANFGFSVNGEFDSFSSGKNDQFYIDQIKNALTNIVKQDGGHVGSSFAAGSSIRDHDYTVRA